MLSGARFTRFPNLHDTINPDQQNAVFSATWPLGLPNDLLVLSWAVLLHSYTGIASPVFSFDGQAVQADLQLASWVKVDVEDASGQDPSHTSLALTEVSAIETRFSWPAI